MDLITKLKEENEALKSTMNELESKVKTQDEKIQSLQKLNDWYIEQLKLKNKEKFGSLSEKADQNQLSLFDLFNEAETLKEPIMPEPTEETIIKAHKRKKSKRGSSLSNLPVETIEYQLSDEEKSCNICKNALTEMKKEIRKELKVVPAKVSIIEHITYVYSCRTCDKEGTGSFIKKADSPNALIPKSMVSPSIMSFILIHSHFDE